MLNIFENLCQNPIQEKMSEPIETLPKVTAPEDAGVQRRRSFALFSELKGRFEEVDISENAFWCYMLQFRGQQFTGSRKQLADRDWTVIAARLHSARDNTSCFSQLVDEIKTKGSCRVYRINPDFSQERIFTGIFEKSLWERAEKYADKTGVNVLIVAYGSQKIFTPPVNSSRMSEGSPPITESEVLEMSK